MSATEKNICQNFTSLLDSPINNPAEKIAVLRKINHELGKDGQKIKTHGLLDELLAEIRDFTTDGKVDKKLLPREESVDTSDLPENIRNFTESIRQSGDTELIHALTSIVEAYRNNFSAQEKDIAHAVTSHVHNLNKAQIDDFYNTYGKPLSSATYSLSIDIGSRQSMYLVSPGGVPLLHFDISSGRSRWLTPLGEFHIGEPQTDNRVRYFRVFGQEYKKQVIRGMLDWGESPQMTTAILPIDASGNIYIHGTNKESRLWTQDSDGCIRMDNFSIALLSILAEKNLLKNTKIISK